MEICKLVRNTNSKEIGKLGKKVCNKSAKKVSIYSTKELSQKYGRKVPWTRKKVCN